MLREDDAMAETGFVLEPTDLWSKWGFNDGDPPQEIVDAESAGVIPFADWRTVLIRLVREHLLPHLSRPVEVYELYTAHNPIRAVGDEDGIPDWAVPEAPVVVPWAAVFDLVRATA